MDWDKRFRRGLVSRRGALRGLINSRSALGLSLPELPSILPEQLALKAWERRDAYRSSHVSIHLHRSSCLRCCLSLLQAGGQGLGL